MTEEKIEPGSVSHTDVKFDTPRIEFNDREIDKAAERILAEHISAFKELAK